MASTGLTVILQSRALDRAHYALMLAASSAALDGPTTLFFGVEGVHALASDAWDTLRTAAGEAAPAYLARVEAAGVAHPEDLLEALGELGVRLAACDSGLAVAGMQPGDIRDDLDLEVTGLADILASAGGTRLVYV